MNIFVEINALRALNMYLLVLLLLWSHKHEQCDSAMNISIPTVRQHLGQWFKHWIRVGITWGVSRNPIAQTHLILMKSKYLGVIRWLQHAIKLEKHWFRGIIFRLLFLPKLWKLGCNKLVITVKWYCAWNS